MVRAIAEAHGGPATYRRSGGGGAIFEVTFRMQQEDNWAAAST